MASLIGVRQLAMTETVRFAWRCGALQAESTSDISELERDEIADRQTADGQVHVAVKS